MYLLDIGACEVVLKTKTKENFERRLRAEHSMFYFIDLYISTAFPANALLYLRLLFCLKLPFKTRGDFLKGTYQVIGYFIILFVGMLELIEDKEDIDYIEECIIRQV